MTETIVRALLMLVCVAAFVASCILVGRPADSEIWAKKRVANEREVALRHKRTKFLARGRPSRTRYLLSGLIARCNREASQPKDAERWKWNRQVGRRITNPVVISGAVDAHSPRGSMKPIDLGERHDKED